MGAPGAVGVSTMGHRPRLGALHQLVDLVGVVLARLRRDRPGRGGPSRRCGRSRRWRYRAPPAGRHHARRRRGGSRRGPPQSRRRSPPRRRRSGSAAPDPASRIRSCAPSPVARPVAAPRRWYHSPMGATARPRDRGAGAGGMATPEEQIPLKHLPLDVLRLTDRAWRGAGAGAAGDRARRAAERGGRVAGERRAAGARGAGASIWSRCAANWRGGSTRGARWRGSARPSTAPPVDRAAGVSLKLTRTGLQRFILEAGERVTTRSGRRRSTCWCRRRSITGT